MKDNKFEALSALFDGENEDATDLLKRVSADPELKSRWEEHYRTKAVIHGEYAPVLDSGFSARVSAALESEPAILSPRAIQPKRDSQPAQWRKPAIGFAIAATVAAVSVFGLSNFSTTPQTANGTVESIATQTVTPTVEVRRVSLQEDNGIRWQHPQGGDKERDAELEKRLNMYLADHMEHANPGKVQGVLPYSRLVGYDTAE